VAQESKTLSPRNAIACEDSSAGRHAIPPADCVTRGVLPNIVVCLTETIGAIGIELPIDELIRQLFSNRGGAWGVNVSSPQVGHETSR